MNAQPQPTGAGIAPLCFAIGIAVLLVGLIVSPLVIAPLGGAITVAAGFVGFVEATRRRARQSSRPSRQPSRKRASATHAADCSSERTRSRLLERATLGLGGLVALGVALPAAGFAEGEFVVATFLADPQAGEVSRRAAYVRNNGLLGTVPSFTIMSSRCTHVGCPTQPNGPLLGQQRMTERTAGGEVALVPAQPSGFGCPCHGSQFDNRGNRTAGPAPRALDRYEFSIRNGCLSLGRLYSVSRVDGTGAQALIHSFALKGDGEPATGPEAWLYPLDAPS